MSHSCRDVAEVSSFQASEAAAVNDLDIGLISKDLDFISLNTVEMATGRT